MRGEAGVSGACPLLPARDGVWVPELTARDEVEAVVPGAVAKRETSTATAARRSAGRCAGDDVTSRWQDDEAERPADLGRLWAAVAVKPFGLAAKAAPWRVTAPRLELEVSVPLL